MSGPITGKVTLDSIIKFFDNFEQRFATMKKNVLIKAQELLLMNIKRLAPRNTGTYADSWQNGEITDNSITIETDQGELYIILEFTGSHVPAQKRKPPEKPFVFKDKEGNTVFTFTIKAKGFDKIPHAKIALELTMEELGDIVKEEFAILFKS